MNSRQADLLKGQDLAESGRVEEAFAVANRYLKHNPNDPDFLTLMVHTLIQNEKPTIAYSLAKRVTQILPRAPGAWLNLGRAAADMWLAKDAVRAYKKSLALSFLPEQKQAALVNMCATLIDFGRFEEAEPYALQAIEIDPKSHKSIANLGFCQLAQRKWVPGWENYHKSLTEQWRPRTQYFDEPEWDGSEANRVVLQAEQGIGDVIGFASMIPDVQKKVKNVVFECDPKLVGLMKRSFPDITVYGTRFTDNVERQSGFGSAVWSMVRITPSTMSSM